MSFHLHSFLGHSWLALLLPCFWYTFLNLELKALSERRPEVCALLCWKQRWVKGSRWRTCQFKAHFVVREAERGDFTEGRIVQKFQGWLTTVWWWLFFFSLCTFFCSSLAALVEPFLVIIKYDLLPRMPWELCYFMMWHLSEGEKNYTSFTLVALLTQHHSSERSHEKCSFGRAPPLLCCTHRGSESWVFFLKSPATAQLSDYLGSPLQNQLIMWIFLNQVYMM